MTTVFWFEYLCNNGMFVGVKSLQKEFLVPIMDLVLLSKKWERKIIVARKPSQMILTVNINNCIMNIRTY